MSEHLTPERLEKIRQNAEQGMRPSCEDTLRMLEMIAERDGTVSVPMKLMKEAHAVMWESGWHNANLYQKSDDGIIEAAATGIERAFSEITGFGK